MKNLTACAPTADIALAGGWAAAMDIVRDLMDRERVWDPLMVALGAPSDDESRKTLVGDISEGVVEKMHARGALRIDGTPAAIQCGRRATQEKCRGGIAPQVTQWSLAYEEQLDVAHDTCRDSVLNAPEGRTTAYERQVAAVTNCIAAHGFTFEIAAIRASAGSPT